jgi:hypothetical protein
VKGTTRRPRGETGACAAGRESAMKAVFWTYLVIIATGLAYFTVIGLTHH